MDARQYDIAKLTDHLFRHQSGKMVAVLTHIFGTENLQTAEDVVQDTLLQALEIWKLKGIPDNPEAWLYRVAKNKAIDIVRRNKFSVQYDFSDNERKLLTSEYTLAATMENLWQDQRITDDLLRMMYACCHPEIAPENRVALILKTLCGFSTAEIAKAFLLPEDTISKRLYRTKEFFRERKIRPEFPGNTDLKERTGTVLKSIYLIFNEGYNATHSDTFIRKDLLQQSIYLCGLLCDNANTQLPEVYAAMALMYLHAARVDSRVSNEGDMILLAEQDRTLWDKHLIDLGNYFLNKAAFGDTLSTYHLEAAIAYEHCSAASFEDTDWNKILMYYNWLVSLSPSPVIALNRLMVIYKLHGAQKTLEETEASPYRADWEKNYLYHSLLGELYLGTDNAKAKEAFEKALNLTQSAAEQKLIRKKVNQLID